MSENSFKVKISKRDESQNQNAQTFNQFQFIKDIYECEKQMYILENRMSQLLSSKIKGERHDKFEQSVEYYDYKKSCKSIKMYPKKVDKATYHPVDWFTFPLIEGGFIGAIVGLVITIITFIDGDVQIILTC